MEFDDGIIAIKEKDKGGELYYCNYSGGLIDELGTDFDKVLKEKINYDATMSDAVRTPVSKPGS